MIRLLVLICPLFLCVNTFFAQLLINSSLEGTPNQIATTPPNWTTCDQSSSPDIMPGPWNVSFAPSDKNSYLNLVVKENGVFEEALGELREELDTSSCYLISLDWAVTHQFVIEYFGDWYNFTFPANLRVVVSSNVCYGYKDSILELDSLYTEDQWHNVSKIFKPSHSHYKNLKLETYVDDPNNPYYGHVLIDNIKLYQSGDTITDSVISTCFEKGDIVQIGPNPRDGFTYLWETGDVNCTTCCNTTIQMDKSGVAILKAQDSSSCYTEYYKYQYAVKPGVPNVITPNSDGSNDLFIIENIGEDSHLSVFNRWGNLVYQNENYQNNWDASLLSDGTYFFVLNFCVLNSSCEFKENGTINVFR